MSQDRRTILDMLAAGQVTADEAERLLAALDKSETTAPRREKKYLRVEVDGDARRDDAPRVNIRVPMQLLRAGVKLASLVPGPAQERVNRALHAHGIDLSQIKPENLDAIVEQLQDLSIDVEDENRKTKVRVFCE
jgi:SHOCT-like protein